MEILFIDDSSIDHCLDIRDAGIISEECGLGAAINLTNASRLVYDLVSLQEHRGEKGAGIVSFDDGELHVRRRVGNVKHQFEHYDFSNLPGDIAIGHNRYATAGSPNDPSNVQPLVINQSKYGPFAIAHNGTLANIARFRQDLLECGAIFQSNTDSEIFAHLIASSSANTLEDAITSTAKDIGAAFSILIMTPDQTYALRDPFGVRPLSVGKFEDGFLLASESYALDQFPGCVQLEDIAPGQMAIFRRGNNTFTHIDYANEKEHFCIFEGIYFSNPRSGYNGVAHEDFRTELGRQLARDFDYKIEGDAVVVPILDSGKQAAQGFAEESGIDYREAFLRIHNPPKSSNRSFTSIDDKARLNTAYKKFNLRKELVAGKTVITVDDSIVRSNTMRVTNKRLREAGARQIINCISAPPIRQICPNGMDYQTQGELVAYGRNVDEIRKIIDANHLAYLRLESLNDVVNRTYKAGICTGCFGGKYPIEPLQK